MLAYEHGGGRVGGSRKGLKWGNANVLSQREEKDPFFNPDNTAHLRLRTCSRVCAKLMLQVQTVSPKSLRARSWLNATARQLSKSDLHLASTELRMLLILQLRLPWLPALSAANAAEHQPLLTTSQH